MKDLFDIFRCFAKIGICAFGGGYMMLPLFSKELVQKRGWLTENELTDYYALAQCMPGLIAVNTAMLITSERKGKPAALVAALAIILPSILVILLIAALLTGFADNIYVQRAFAGIRVAVAALILHTAYKLIRNGVTGLCSGVIAAAAFLLLLFDVCGPIAVIAGAAVCALICSRLRPAKGGAR